MPMVKEKSKQVTPEVRIPSDCQLSLLELQGAIAAHGCMRYLLQVSRLPGEILVLLPALPWPVSRVIETKGP